MQVVKLDEYNYAYKLYLINEEYEENYHSFLTQNILNEGYTYITEGDKIDAIKGFIEKIIQSVKDAFNKFKEKIKDFFMKDKDYFTKYKDVIIKVPPIDANITNYYEYDIDKIRNSKLPNFDSEKFKKYADQDAFIKGEFPEYAPANGQKFTDKVKEVFRGGEAKTVSASTLKLDKMMDYINNYEKLCSELEKDVSTFDDASLKVKAKLKLAKNSGATPVKKEKPKQESFTYQSTLDYYFNEEVGVETPAGGTTAEAPKATTTAAQPTNNVTNAKDDKNSGGNNQNSSTTANNNISKNDDRDIEANAMEEERKMREEEAKENEANEKVTKMYYNVCAEFLGIKFAIASEAYKTYVKIIKWHVNAYLKEHEGEKPENNNGQKEEKKGKDTTNINKGTKLYYEKDGTIVYINPNTDEDAKAIYSAGKFKDADGNEYPVKVDNGDYETCYYIDNVGTWHEIKPKNMQEELDYKKPGAKINVNGQEYKIYTADNRPKEKPATKFYVVDDDGYSVIGDGGNPLYIEAKDDQQYSQMASPTYRYSYKNVQYKVQPQPGKSKTQQQQQKQNQKQEGYPTYYFKDGKGKIWTVKPQNDAQAKQFEKPNFRYIYNGIKYPLTTDKASLNKK